MNIIYYTSIGIIAVILAIYYLWFTNTRLPRNYRDFIQTTVPYKDYIENKGYLFLTDETVEKGKLPKFIIENRVEEFKAMVKDSSEIKKDDKYRIVNSLCSLIEELKYKAKLEPYITCSTIRIKKYRPIPKKVHIIMISILIASLCSSFIIRPLANAETLKKYQKIGIENFEDRYIEETIIEKQNLKIVDRYYQSRLFGGEYYKFKVLIVSPYIREVTLQVDPILYQNKRIGDTIKVSYQYTKRVDRYKGKIEYFHNSETKILE